MIYTIGDSHSKFGWEKINHVKVNHLGSKLMYTFNLDPYEVPYVGDNHCLVFSYGEIDVRCHMHRHFLNRDLDVEIQKMSRSYIEKVSKICKERAISLDNVYVYCVIPPRRIDSIEPYNTENLLNYVSFDLEKSEPFPILGRDTERKNYNYLLNENLKKVCNEYGIGFIDVTKEYSDTEGYLDMRLSDGTVHIDNPKFLLTYLEKYMHKFLTP